MNNSTVAMNNAPAGERPLRSKGLLPAVGVGAAVYLVTGVVSLSTLGLIGIGAGVGYGVGSWLADKYQDKKGGATRSGQEMGADQHPWALQVSLQQWQAYLQERVGGPQGQSVDPQQVEQIFAEFTREQPVHAQNVRTFVNSEANQAAPASSAGVPTVTATPSGPIIVPNQAAEV